MTNLSGEREGKENEEEKEYDSLNRHCQVGDTDRSGGGGGMT
jgi:hypothetical protein